MLHSRAGSKAEADFLRDVALVSPSRACAPARWDRFRGSVSAEAPLATRPLSAGSSRGRLDDGQVLLPTNYDSGDLIAEILADTGLEVIVPRDEGATFILGPIGYIHSTEKVDVVLESAGDNQMQVIKVVRQVVSGLGVMEAKGLVQSVPKPIVENVAMEAATAAKEKLEAVGATITIKRSHAD